MRLLTDTKSGLPSSWYFDAQHYARELAAVWYQDWVCVGRAETLQRPGDYFVATIGSQSIIITSGRDKKLKAFHNTCRHRGAALCRNDHGRFRNDRIICPYHTWTYSIDGGLLETPGRIDCEDFDAANYSLYAVHVDSWGGFVFVNLAESPESGLQEFLGAEAAMLKNWPLADMRSVHQEKIAVACNWKIFWENYNECYHCPRVHPELCKIMPVYKQAVFDHKDLSDWRPTFEGDSGFGSVGDGAKTWTLSGHSSLPTIAGLTPQEIELGVMFSSVTGSMYVVGHPEYVRSVRIVPTGPESIELVVDWLLPRANADVDDAAIESIVGLVRLVIQQDGEVCELNQRGLHCMRHDSSVLVPQEFELWRFHEWLRGKLTLAGA
jgi:Rieske 2Fe-2S family protein